MGSKEGCEISWFDSCNIPGLFDWIIGIAGLLGLGVAIWQLCRSAGALKAARQTYLDTRAHLALGQLTAIHPDLAAQSEALGQVLDRVERAPAMLALTEFAKQATVLASLLEIASEDQMPTVRKLKQTATDALAAADRLDRSPKTVKNGELVRHAASSMRTTVTTMAGTITLLRNTPAVVKGRKGRG